jgi:hypothetical protein
VFAATLLLQALCFDQEEDMLAALEQDTEKFRGKVVIIRWDYAVTIMVLSHPAACRHRSAPPLLAASSSLEGSSGVSTGSSSRRSSQPVLLPLSRSADLQPWVVITLHASCRYLSDPLIPLACKAGTAFANQNIHPFAKSTYRECLNCLQVQGPQGRARHA